MQIKRILLLGSTGSIGTQALDVISRHSDRFEVVGLAAGTDVAAVVRQANLTGARQLGMAGVAAAAELAQEMPEATVFAGPQGLVDMVYATQPDLVIGAISGFAGLPSTLAALELGINVALANKEPLVAAGELVMSTARRCGAEIIPVDSELSAMFQCLNGEARSSIARILLTASGGPFATLAADELSSVTAAQALAHPTWKMGQKVTIDSATLANKGFEIFEVRWLFDVSFSQIQVVVHHQSVIHSLVDFCDTSVIAQVGWPDMRVPIQYALSYPDRIPSGLEPLNLVEAGPLTFADPDTAKFPCLKIARQAGEMGGGYPVVLTGADEGAVRRFLNGEIRFTDIPVVLERALDAYDGSAVNGLSEIQDLNDWAVDYVTELKL